MWDHLPYSLLGLASPEIEQAKSAAIACRLEWSNCRDKQKVHRVAQLFFRSASLSAQLDAFCESSEPLSKFPALHNLAHAYALTPLVERSIEAEHAKIGQVSKLGLVNPASVCSRIRAEYTLSLLADGDFLVWCSGRWQTHVFRTSLEPLHLDTKGWKRKRFLEAIYLFGIEEQYSDVVQMKDELKAWDDARMHALVPVKLALPPVQVLCLEWLKMRMSAGRFLALPSTLCRFVQYVGYCRAADGELTHTLGDVLALVGCDDVLAERAPVGDFEVFRIVNSGANRRILQHPWHLGPRPLVVRVARYSRLPDIQGQMVFSSTGGHCLFGFSSSQWQRIP